MFYCIKLSHKNGLISSGIIYLSWIFYALNASTSIIDWFFNEFNIKSISYWIEVLWVIFVFIQLILFSFADARCSEDKKKFEETPENSASFLNRQLYWWMNKLFKIGSKKNIETKDLFKLNYGFKAKVLVLLWERYWTPTIKGCFFNINNLFFIK